MINSGTRCSSFVMGRQAYLNRLALVSPLHNRSLLILIYSFCFLLMFPMVQDALFSLFVLLLVILRGAQVSYLTLHSISTCEMMILFLNA